jgi:hypothetical protein
MDVDGAPDITVELELNRADGSFPADPNAAPLANVSLTTFLVRLSSDWHYYSSHDSAAVVEGEEGRRAVLIEGGL